MSTRTRSEPAPAHLGSTHEVTETAGQGISGAVGAVLGAAFEATSSLRRARTFHPRGIVVQQEVIIPTDAGPPGFPDGSRDVIVRMSRGIGLPGSFPDIPGLAIRFVDAGGPEVHQDLLLATTFDGRLGRTVLRPTTSFTSGRFTSLLPYDAGGQRVVFGADIDTGGSRAHDIDELAAVLADRPVEITLHWATPTSPWRTIGTLVLGPTDQIADLPSLAFDVTNCVPGIRPAGFLNQLRPAAYLGSRVGRKHIDTVDPATGTIPPA